MQQQEQTVKRAAASRGSWSWRAEQSRKAGRRKAWLKANRAAAAAPAAVRMTLTIVGNAVKAILSNETKVRETENERERTTGKRRQYQSSKREGERERDW